MIFRTFANISETNECIFRPDLLPFPPFIVVKTKHRINHALSKHEIACDVLSSFKRFPATFYYSVPALVISFRVRFRYFYFFLLNQRYLWIILNDKLRVVATKLVPSEAIRRMYYIVISDGCTFSRSLI